MAPSPPPWLSPLLAKYTELLRLRRGDLDGSIPDPRPAMAALAHAFPGALREIDRCPLSELERREAYLRELLAHPAEPGREDEPWAPLEMRYHELLRGALEAKRWLATLPPDSEREARALHEASGLGWSTDALAWASELHRIASPPRGRLVAVVLERLARESLRTTEELRELLFEYGPRLARRGGARGARGAAAGAAGRRGAGGAGGAGGAR